VASLILGMSAARLFLEKVLQLLPFPEQVNALDAGLHVKERLGLELGCLLISQVDRIGRSNSDGTYEQ